MASRTRWTPIAWYVSLVALAGGVVVAASLQELLGQGPDYRMQWLSLVALTVVSGLLPVPLPSINVSVSTSETFVIAGTILFGQAGGTVLALLDALFISVYLIYSKGLRPQQFIYNITATPLSIWLAAELAGVEPLFRTPTPFGAASLIQLGAFSTAALPH